MLDKSYRVRGRLVVTLGLAATFVLSACSGASEDAQSGARPDMEFVAPFLPTHLDPGQGIDSLFSFAETLTKVDANGEVVPFLLAEEPRSEDPSTWTLTLKPDITFQNGSSLDGEALAACLARSVKENPAAAAYLPGATFEATGPLEVTVKTAAKIPQLPSALADLTTFGIYDADVVSEAANTTDALAGEGVFTAPYSVTEYNPQGMELEAYDGYWQGEPALSAIHVTRVPEAQARIAAVESGQADIASGANVPDVIQAITGRDDLLLKLTEVPLLSYRLYLNPASPPLDELAVRQAIVMALDYDELANEFTGGVGVPAHGMFPDSFPLNVETQNRDLDEANRLLDSAGWVSADDGARTKDGQKLTVTLLAYNERQEFQPLGIGLQAQLKEIGVDVKIVTQPFDYKMYDDVTAWDLALWSDYSVSPSGVPDGYLPSYLSTDGEGNLWQTGDADLDGMLAELVTTTDPDVRETLLKDIQQHVWEMAYVVNVAFGNEGDLVREDWKDHVPGDGYQRGYWDWQTVPST